MKMMTDPGIHVEELRTFRGLVLTSPDGEYIMIQSTEFGAVKAMPITFNREEAMKVYNWLTKVLLNDEGVYW